MPSLPILPYDTTDNETVAKAKALAEKWNLPYGNAGSVSELRHNGGGLALVLTPERLELRSFDEPKFGAVYVDFSSDTLTLRRTQGRAKKEAIARAIGLKGQAVPSVLDATAGLGRDAFILASLGCKVDMIERSAAVAALLSDGLERACSNQTLKDWLPERMKLFHDASLPLLKDWQGDQPDVVYLDPMFPHRKKSALVKKEMRLFQQFLGPDEDADALLEPAFALAKQRVVVKRPDTAPYLNDCEPNMSISGKKLRFDVYLTHLK